MGGVGLKGCRREAFRVYSSLLFFEGLIRL